MIGTAVMIQVLLFLLPKPSLSLTTSHGLPLLARPSHHHHPTHHSRLLNPHTAPHHPPPPPHAPPPAPRILHAAPHKAEFDVPTNYHFTYHVADSYSGDVHHHTESKTDYTTQGQYSVKLPDGRTQVVTYTADDDGYHATVEYHGDINHHPPPPPPDYHDQHLPPLDYHDQPLINEIPREKIYKYNPTPTTPLLPKLFVPQDPPTLKKPQPAIKLEKPVLPVEPSHHHLPALPVEPSHHLPVLPLKPSHQRLRYSYSPTPYPAKEVRTPIYKGKIVFVNKP